MMEMAGAAGASGAGASGAGATKNSELLEALRGLVAQERRVQVSGECLRRECNALGCVNTPGVCVEVRSLITGRHQCEQMVVGFCWECAKKPCGGGELPKTFVEGFVRWCVLATTEDGYATVGKYYEDACDGLPLPGYPGTEYELRQSSLDQREGELEDRLGE